jgi:ubiquitin carboxyl-terminal hydrolase 22/27/51
VHQCPHLQEFKENGGVESYTVIQKYLETCKVGIAEQCKLPLPRCYTCSDYSGRLHACLQCVFIACWNEGHIKKHFEDSKHHLATDIALGSIYCYQCGDYVYDSTFDGIAEIERHNALACKLALQDSTPNHATYHDWKPNDQENQTLQTHSKPYSVPRFALGLRGLINLGNTCFMNSILQSFIHNPLMRNYFLSDMHNRRQCSQTAERHEGVCLGCEMDILFAKIFSGTKAPYTPHHLLYSIWKYANYFAGYEQQDAHEFLISSLNGIHTHCGGVPKDCTCIIHRIFYGVLRSDLTCASCGFTSMTYDPFFDISLDLPKPRTHKAGEKRHSDESENGNTLIACLDRFTQKERLGTEEKFLCSQCHTRQESIKQLSMKCLPIVACFHLKRFEQAANPRHSNKIDTFIEFPEVLDLSPYHSTRVLPSKAAPSGKADEETMYDLIAVVNHQGKMDTGHYTSFVKHDSLWFKCDDATITRATLQQVLRSKGYLLFYMKRHVEYDVKSSTEK